MQKSPPVPDLGVLLPSRADTPADTPAGTPATGRGPALCGDIDMRIDQDGTWYYGGTPIGRKELVRLFASVLQRLDDGYWLITPAEKARIQVDDAPFAAVEVVLGEDAGVDAGDGPVLRVRTNLDAWLDLGEDHPLRVGETPGGDRAPYVLVRDGLEARFTRSAYYDLVGRGVFEPIDGEDVFGVWSGACFFPLGSTTDEEAEGGAP